MFERNLYLRNKEMITIVPWGTGVYSLDECARRQGKMHDTRFYFNGKEAHLLEYANGGKELYVIIDQKPYDLFSQKEGSMFGPDYDQCYLSSIEERELERVWKFYDRFKKGDKRIFAFALYLEKSNWPHIMAIKDKDSEKYFKGIELL